MEYLHLNHVFQRDLKSQLPLISSNIFLTNLNIRSIQDCSFSRCYNFRFMLLHLHRPSLCFYHHVHLCGLMYFHLCLFVWLYFCIDNILLPCVNLHYLCFHKVLLHSFVFLQFFNEH